MNKFNLIGILCLLSASLLFSNDARVLYRCGETSASQVNIKPHISIENLSASDLILSELTLRYFYTSEESEDQSFVCDYAAIGKEKVTGTFYTGWVEIGFIENAGRISPGNTTGEIQIRLHKNNWSPYNQADDYSFNPDLTTYTEWNRICLYQNNTLIWGIPGGGSDITAAPEDPGTSTPTPGSTPAPVTALPGNDDWLHAQGNTLLDLEGNPVWLTGLNWFGFNTGSNMFDGMWACDLKDSLTAMANRGFNSLRIPVSTELIYNWMNGIYPVPGSLNSYGMNEYLKGKNSFEIFNITLEHCKTIGLKVILDVHSPESLPLGHMHPLWYINTLTPEIFNSTWTWIVNYYKNDDTIVGVDLENEPHGVSWNGEEYAKWDGSNDLHNWRRAAEETGLNILSVNPNILVIVQGIESYPIDDTGDNIYGSMNQDDYYNGWWGGNLRGVAKFPINLGSRQSQLMYSCHDYGPNVYEQVWFYEGFNKDTLYNDCWYPNWFYIIEAGIAPVFVGEWGGKLDGDRNENWMAALRQFIIEQKLHHSWWSFNNNSGDTAGLILGDWITWDEAKYAFIEPSLWQDNNGKYVGLDHEQALGSNMTGTTIGLYYASNNPPPVPPGNNAQTPVPTAVTTQESTAAPSAVPTAEPTSVPTPAPTEISTPVPTETPTDVPSAEPTTEPTVIPTPVPTETPTDVPSAEPTTEPTVVSTPAPTAEPTAAATPVPTAASTTAPTDPPEVTDEPITPPGQSGIIFSDNFDDGNISDWSISGPAAAYNNTPANGSYCVRSTSTGTITKTISTAGYENIVVAFNLAGYSYDSGEYMAGEYNTGSGWVGMAQIPNGQDNRIFQYKEISLPGEANNNANLQIRFRLSTNSSWDYGYVDDVVVSGGGGTTPTDPPVVTDAPTDVPTTAPTNLPVITDTPTNPPANTPAPTAAATEPSTPAPTDTPVVTPLNQGVVFEDDFEDGNIAGWTVSGYPSIYTGDPRNGSYSVRFRSTDSISITVNTGGYSNIIVTYNMAGYSYDANEFIAAEYNSGAGWVEMIRIPNGQDDRLFRYNETNLPATADNNPNLIIRFRLSTNSSRDYGYVDDIVIKAMGE